MESSTLPAEENGMGMVTARTFFGPTASTARQHVTAESIPPDKPEDGLREAAFPHVVAEAEDERLVDRFDPAERLEKPGRPGPPRIDGQDVFLEGRADGHGLAPPVEGETAAVENELVVRPDLVDEDEGPAVLAGVSADEAEADLFLAGVERRGRDVEKERRALAREHADGIEIVEPALRPQLRRRSRRPRRW